MLSALTPPQPPQMLSMGGFPLRSTIHSRHSTTQGRIMLSCGHSTRGRQAIFARYDTRAIRLRACKGLPVGIASTERLFSGPWRGLQTLGAGSAYPDPDKALWRAAYRAGAWTQKSRPVQGAAPYRRGGVSLKLHVLCATSNTIY